MLDQNEQSEAELEALRICALCDKGIHPREHAREKRNKNKKHNKKTRPLKTWILLCSPRVPSFFLLFSSISLAKPSENRAPDRF